MATIKKRRTRPDFESDTACFWFNHEHFSNKEKSKLLKRLPVKMPDASRADFMDRVIVIVQSFEWLKRTTTESGKRDQLQNVADQARELLRYMGFSELQDDTKGVIRAFGKDFLFTELQAPQITDASMAAARENKLLPFFWDTIQDIETVFAYAAAQMQPSKQDRPAISNAKAFAAEIARAYFAVMDAWPPYSKETWFPMLIGDLVNAMGGDTIGHGTIKTAIQEAKKQV